LIQGFEQYTRADVVKIASKELGIAASVELVPDVDDGSRHPASLLGTSTLHPSLPIDCTFIPKSKPFLAICLKRAILMTHRLISLGYKVGVISQMETAALKKVGENRNAPFTRELTHLFTAATYVQPPHLTSFPHVPLYSYVEDPSLASSSNFADEPVMLGSAPPPTNALVAIVEQDLGGLAADDRVRIGLVSVVPTTGEVVWDEFDGTWSR